MYILFEGIDGVGKSTQIARLAAAFPHAVATKEPGGTKLGEAVRSLVLGEDFTWRGGGVNLHKICGEISKRAELLLFLADRAEHYERVVKASADKLVLSDRGFISGMAYALAGGDFSFEEILGLNKFALQGNLPRKIVFFKADENTLRSRLNSRGKIDGIEARGFEYLLKVQDTMEKILQRLGTSYIAVNAADDEEKITNQIKEFIDD